MLPDVAHGVERMEQALTCDEEVVIFADRDIDGVSGCAVLVRLLESLEANVTSYIPDKWDGYGLNESFVNEIAEQGRDLLITVDCGSTASEEIELARSADIDVLVTDHHQPNGQLPSSVACINPRRTKCEYPHENLAGGAVAFKLGEALVESLNSVQIDDYHRYALPLAALATLGDWMPLNLENRSLVQEGFARLWYSGLTGLIRTARYRNVESIRDLGWSLIPFLNAAQEDESGDLMLRLLLSRDEEHISAVISTLEDYREQRSQRLSEQKTHLMDRFEDQVNPEEDDIFLVETNRYVGGSAISQLSEQWGRPIITYRRKNGEYRGGGRSEPDVNFLSLFESCEDLLEDYWGHPGAAGFRVSEHNLEEFERRIRKGVSSRYGRADLVPTIEIDTTIQSEDLDGALVEEIEQLRPFGNGNPEPKFLLEGVDIAGFEQFGDQNRHVRLLPTDIEELSIIYWNGMDTRDEFSHPTTYNIVGSVQMDDYEQQPMLDVSDCRVATDDIGDKR